MMWQPRKKQAHVGWTDIKNIPAQRAWPLPSQKGWVFCKDILIISQLLQRVKKKSLCKGDSIMEEFVRKIMSKYLSFTAEKQMYERWLSMRNNPEVREALVVVDMKVTMIQSWLNLLNSDERFVIEKHLIEELEWPRVSFSFTELWKGEFTRAERTLVAYQASGLNKIVSFCEDHQSIVMALFEDLWEERFSQQK